MINEIRAFLDLRGISLCVLGSIAIILAFNQSIFFNERLQFHLHDHEKLRTYHNSPICQDTSLKSKTEGKNHCDHYALMLKTSPMKRALQDVLQDMYPHLINIVFFSAIGCAILLILFVMHTKKAMEKANEIHMALPILFPKHSNKKSC
jgi:energy-converting hydrogenase Eha subunit C